MFEPLREKVKDAVDSLEQLLVCTRVSLLPTDPVLAGDVSRRKLMKWDGGRVRKIP